MQIKYISWLPGIIGTDNEEIQMHEDNFTLENLMDLIAARKGRFQTIFSQKNIIFASRNGKVIQPADVIQNSDSITFFSPIAGG